MEIAGIWKGYYQFGLSYQLPYFGQRVNFRMELHNTPEGFEGTCEEEESDFSTHRISTIKGFIEEDLISFIKTYPDTQLIAEDSISLVIQEGESEVEYTGYVDEKHKALYGEWLIYADNEVGTVDDDLFRGDGTWGMKKAE